MYSNMKLLNFNFFFKFCYLLVKVTTVDYTCHYNSFITKVAKLSL